MSTLPTRAKTMRSPGVILLISGLVLAQAAPQLPAPLKRTPISQHHISPDKSVTTVSVVRIDYKPAQRTGRHIHPMPVVGYVLEGSFVVKVSGATETHYTVGQSIYEPAETVIERFDNDSPMQPAVLIAHYLAGPGQTELVRILPDHE
jgi:quercetin dioxygenase-like cupin family protein